MLNCKSWAGAWLVCASLVACNAPYPDGKIACSADEDCPSGFSCREGAVPTGELFCFQGGKAEESRSPSTSQQDAAISGSEDERRDEPGAGGAGTSSPRAGAGAQNEAAANGGAGTGGSGARAPTPVAGRTAQAGERGRAGQSADDAQAGRAAQGGDNAQAGRTAQAGEPGQAGQSGAAGQGPKPDAGTPDAGNPPRCDPATSECEPGSTSEVSLRCGWCNSGTQPATRSCGSDCRWSKAVPSAECTNVMAACEPKDEKTESRGCECGRTQQRRVTCSDACEWVASDWGACDLSGVECQPGGSETRNVPCASCGTRTEQRTCAANSCKWGGWSQLSAACASSCEDCAEVQFCMAPSGQPNPGGTKCRQMLRACTREQALADCQEDIPVVCGKVTPPFFMQYL